MNDLISRLSEMRSNYNCFDENEEPYYRALSEAIQLASAQPEQKGWVCPVCRKSGYLCEFATEHGYCQITVCVKEPLAGKENR